MAKLLATIKAVITRLVFSTHGIVAIWQVTIFKKNSFFWYLCSPILLLFFEGIFTLTIKENQEWKWFCPSVFLYLASVVPAIWLLELDKVDRRLRTREETFNLTTSAGANLKDLHNLIGVQIKLPDINLSTETWITLIEQFLMLILIIGRWMLPKGDLTRDQLSQILLVYIGTAADIIEFFDSFKDDKVASEPILVLLTLAIWTWSLMQFTVVLTATKSRKSRMSSTGVGSVSKNQNTFCNIDVWGIALNITLQDAPFLAFRLLIIVHYKIISYMNVFFTCKNTLVILLQLYRLHVVYSENHKLQQKKAEGGGGELTDISIISDPRTMKTNPSRRRRREPNRNRTKRPYTSTTTSAKQAGEGGEQQPTKIRKVQNGRKDTGYSTASSHASNRGNSRTRKSTSHEERVKGLSKSRGTKRKQQQEIDALSEETGSDFCRPEGDEDEESEESNRRRRKSGVEEDKKKRQTETSTDLSSE